MRSVKRNRLIKEAQADYDKQVALKLTPVRNSWYDLWLESFKGKIRKVGKKKKVTKKKTTTKKKEE